MSRYIDADNAIERLGAYLMADAQIEYGGMASEDINDWKKLASVILKGTPSIDLEADYVPKDFHDKTCEAMAKRHQEEIADMVSVVRCKECRHWGGCKNTMHNSHKCGRAENVDYWTRADDFCSYGERSDNE